MGGARSVGGQEKELMGCFLDDVKSVRYQRRPVDDCSPGRGGMGQDGGTRSGMFHGEMDRCREGRAGLRHAVVCPSVTGQDSPKQACSGWFARQI